MRTLKDLDHVMMVKYKSRTMFKAPLLRVRLISSHRKLTATSSNDNGVPSGTVAECSTELIAETRRKSSQQRMHSDVLLAVDS